MDLGKSALVTPFYLSVSWVMLVSYQIFTQTAVDSIVNVITVFWPSIGSWMISHIDIIVFMHAFAWIFVLSSLIPSVILGKERSVLIQFLVCLTLAFIAVSFMDILSLVSGIPFFPNLGEPPIEQIFKMDVWLEKPWLASLFLSAPYLIMFYVDIRERRKKPKINFTKFEDITNFMPAKDYGFKQAGRGTCEVRVIEGNELIRHIECGWELFKELDDGKYEMRRLNRSQ